MFIYQFLQHVGNKQHIHSHSHSTLRPWPRKSRQAGQQLAVTCGQGKPWRYQLATDIEHPKHGQSCISCSFLRDWHPSTRPLGLTSTILGFEQVEIMETNYPWIGINSCLATGLGEIGDEVLGVTHPLMKARPLRVYFRGNSPNFSNQMDPPKTYEWNLQHLAGKTASTHNNHGTSKSSWESPIFQTQKKLPCA